MFKVRVLLSEPRDLKNSGKYGSGLSCRGPYLLLEFSELSLETGLIFYLADFHGRNWRI